MRILAELQVRQTLAEADIMKNRKLKYRVGDPFINIHELVAWLQAGKWVYWHGKPKHPTIISNQSLSTLMNIGSHLYRAIENKEQK